MRSNTRQTHSARNAVQLSVRAQTALLGVAAALAVACSSPPAASGPGAAAPDVRAESRGGRIDDTLQIELGRTASVDYGGLTLTFLARLADSRCPANAVCVWMGDAAVRIAARAGNASVERELHTGVEPHGFSLGAYVVTIVGLTPYPGTEAYERESTTPRVVLRVTKT